MQSLKSTVDLLKQEIVELKESLSSAKSAPRDCDIQVRNENLHPSYSPANTTNGDFTNKFTLFMVLKNASKVHQNIVG